MKGTVPIPPEWADYLRQQPETGMGYQIVTLILKDGRSFGQVAVTDGCVTRVHGYDEIPFSAKDEIHSIKLTHKKWSFREK